MKMIDITTIGRPIDPAYPTNRAIAALSLLVTVVASGARIFAGARILEGGLWGLSAGLTVFLAWALARELDPDEDLAAFVAAGLSIVGLLVAGLPSLLLAFWLLVALRTVNRTVGLPARPLDSIALLGLGSWLTWQGYWPVGLVTVAAFAADGFLFPPLRYHLLVAGAVLLVTIVSPLVHQIAPISRAVTLPWVLVVLIAALLFVLVIVASRTVHSMCDATGEPLNPRRVQAAQIIALLALALLVWQNGDGGIVDLLPLWAALGGTGLYRLTHRLVVR